MNSDAYESRDLHGLAHIISRDDIDDGIAVYVVGDAGVDMPKVAHVIEAMKPLTVAQAKMLIAYGRQAIDKANAINISPVPSLLTAFAPVSTPAIDQGAVDRRNGIKNSLQNADNQIGNLKDPLPDKVAELLRQEVLKAIAEYNAAAEGEETLRKARGQFFSDMIDNLVKLSKEALAAASSTVSWIKWTLITVGALAAIGLAVGIGVGVYSHVKKRK